MDFTGKVVLITGASSGIGADAAVYFSSLGATLSLTGRNEERLKATVKDCIAARKGCEPFYVVGDISEVNDVTNIWNKTIEKFGRLDILVNNAAVAPIATLENITMDIYDQVFNTNMRSTLLLTKLAMPHLIKSKGNVINVSSVLSFRPMTLALPYCMAKAALDQFTKCVALEVASKQVRVNSVNPGGVLTKMITEVAVDNFLDSFSKCHPIGRCANVREISTTIAFLASDLASNVTGANFVVDGGYSINSPM